MVHTVPKLNWKSKIMAQFCCNSIKTTIILIFLKQLFIGHRESVPTRPIGRTRLQKLDALSYCLGSMRYARVFELRLLPMYIISSLLETLIYLKLNNLKEILMPKYIFWYIISALWREEGCTVKYSLSTREFPRAKPEGFHDDWAQWFRATIRPIWIF